MAGVYLDGKYYGNSDGFQLSGRSLLLNPGKYELQIAPADGTAGRKVAIEIQADMTLVGGQEKRPSYEP